MNVPTHVIIIAATIVFSLIVVFCELLEWRERRRSAKRYSVKTRVLIYVAIFTAALAALLFPSVGKALNQIGIYAAVLTVVSVVLLLALLFILFRIGMPALNRVFEEARELDDAGRTLDAITLLENNRPKAKRWSKSFEAVLLTNVAGLYAKLRDWPHALKTADEAISAAPDQAFAYATKAEILRSSGQREESLQFLGGVLSRFEKSVQLQTVLAQIQIELGKKDEAAATLHRVDRLLDEESFVDVVDRDDWRKIRLGALRSQLASGTSAIVKDA